jgi:hypothetical protein
MVSESQYIRDEPTVICPLLHVQNTDGEGGRGAEEMVEVQIPDGSPAIKAFTYL